MSPLSYFGASRLSRLIFASPVFVLRCLRHRVMSLTSVNSPELGCRHCRPGGDDGIRTHDPLLAGQVLSQLSYTPILFWGFYFECPPLPLESLFRSHRRVTASISVNFPEFRLRHCRRSLKIEQQASHTSHLCLLDLSSVVILLYLDYDLSQTPFAVIMFSIERR